MVYEKFRHEVERILEEKATPLTWNEIRACSATLKQKAPYHVYVQKLQGDIGLVRFKSGNRTVWALRKWFEEGKFTDLLPKKVRLTILSARKDHAIGATEDGELKRVYPLRNEVRRWDVVEADVEEFFSQEDKRPESVKLREDGIAYIERLDDDEKRIRLAEKVTESGEFLHTDAWKGKTLGLTKPRFRCFYFYENKCQFFCDQSVCVGHEMDVEEDREHLDIQGDRIFFLVEAIEHARRDFIWEKTRVDWHITAVISVTDPRQRRLF